ncbi:efflux RND transporter permease subunit [Escherichia coli]
MANFFIDRPIFAWVLAILLCLTGTLAIFSLPVEQYPDLAPPNVRVTANYPGASAQTLENTVTQVIEQNMTGLDNLMYMSSQSSGTGQASVTLSFKAGTRSGRSRAASTKPAAISHAKVTAGGAKSGRDGA